MNKFSIYNNYPHVEKPVKKSIAFKVLEYKENEAAATNIWIGDIIEV